MINNLYAEILIVALLTAISCVIPGVFLVLRGMAMMSDAISHAILLGIVGMFLFVLDLESPLLIIGASCVGVLTVICTEIIIKSGKLKKDAAIGLIFPLFFSVGVILIARYARNVHLDIDMVLLGELAFVPFNRLIINNSDYGPYALWIMSFICICNLGIVLFFYKEFLITIFDETYARVSKFYPTFFYYVLMVLTSITAVAAFEVVGSVMVVALMITPAATAYLLSKTVIEMVLLSVIIAIFAVFSGYFLASYADLSIAGSIVTMTGVFFLLTLLCPKDVIRN